MPDGVYGLQERGDIQYVTLLLARFELPAQCRALSVLLDVCLADGAPARVIIDCRCVEFLSEACIGVLRTLGEDCDAEHGHLALYGVEMQVLVALREARCVPHLMTTHRTIEEAKRHFDR